MNLARQRANSDHVELHEVEALAHGPGATGRGTGGDIGAWHSIPENQSCPGGVAARRIHRESLATQSYR